MLPDKIITLSHGGGGKRSYDLLKELIFKYLPHPEETGMGDSGLVHLSTHRIAFTTDSFVVKPLFFPGGDIGSLAVIGTANDLAVSGARPLYLTLSFILEEGLEIEVLERVLNSLKEAAKISGVKIISGDTKVVEKGSGDRIFINTSGIGELLEGWDISPHSLKGDEVIIVNGTIGEHGITIINEREGFGFEGELRSDCAPLFPLIEKLWINGIEVRCMRDLTRGGLGSILKELSLSSGWGMEIWEERVPVKEEVRFACEILGMDPLYLANEGKMVCFVPNSQEEKTLEVLRELPQGEKATVIGRVTRQGEEVILHTRAGGERILDLAEEEIPRIC